jgi:hypothetical protein
MNDNDQDCVQSKYIVEPPVLGTSYSYIIRKEKIEAKHRKENEEKRLK